MDMSSRCTCIRYHYQPGSPACVLCGGSPPLEGLVPTQPTDIPCSPCLLVVIAAIAVISCVTAISAIGGAVLGAIAGALMGRGSGWGLVRGFVLGGAAGAWLSFETFEALRAYLSREQTGSRGSSSVVDLMEELQIFTAIRNRFVEGDLEPALLFYPWQVNVDDQTYGDVSDVYNKFPGGLSRDSLKKLPNHVIVEEAKTEQQDDCCAICLQNVEIGETGRRLPGCHHLFHLFCVDKWLVKQASCPVCRQIVRV